MWVPDHHNNRSMTFASDLVFMIKVPWRDPLLLPFCEQ